MCAFTIYSFKPVKSTVKFNKTWHKKREKTQKPDAETGVRFGLPGSPMAFPAVRQILGITAQCNVCGPARDFVSQRGAKSQEYFVYFKILQQSCGAKDPSGRARGIVR